ncbi:MAG: ATP-binding protein, partial [Thermomicrobiales bacterium]
LHVGPLPVPAGSDQEDLETNPAVELFLAGAGAGRVRDARDLAAVGRIVTLLDGLPLAIELAAAQQQVMSPAAIADLLERAGLRLLEAGWRDSAARFRTMEQAVRWSSDLLAEDGRRLLRLLSVFRGGFTGSLVSLLAGKIGAPDLIAELPGLVNASLVREIPSRSGTVRYAMLEPIRLVAAADLAGAGETGQARDAHAAVMVELAALCSRDHLGGDTASALRVFADERDNFRAALDHLVESRQPAQALRLVNALGFWWEHVGAIREANQWIGRVLSIDDGMAPPRDRWLARWLNSLMAVQAGNFPEGKQLADAVLEIAEAAGDREGLAMGEVALAIWSQTSGGPLEDAIARLDLAISPPVGSGFWLARAMAHHLRGAYLFHGTGDIPAALDDLERSLELFRAHGGESLQAMPLCNLAAALQAAGRRDEAIAAVRQALDLHERLDQPLVQTNAAVRLASLMSEEEDIASSTLAARLLGAFEALNLRYGYSMDDMMLGVIDETSARLKRRLGDRFEAEKLTGRSRAAESGHSRLLDLIAIEPAGRR